MGEQGGVGGDTTSHIQGDESITERSGKSLTGYPHLQGLQYLHASCREYVTTSFICPDVGELAGCTKGEVFTRCCRHNSTRTLKGGTAL